MNYEQFIDAMLECTRRKLPGTDIVEVQEVQKNNGVKLVGLVIRRHDFGIAPVVYMDEFYKRYMSGQSIENLSSMLLERCRHIPEMSHWNFEEFKDFRKIQDKIVYKLINAEENKELLKEIPHLPILDFAIVFFMMLEVSENETGSILIKNSQMDLWNCPISLLYEYAKRNTPVLCPPVLCLLSEVVGVLEKECFDNAPIYLLTNKSGVNGAAALLYPNMPGNIYAMIGRNYYLLPSSIHEFLIVPDEHGSTPEVLKSIVREVNATQVEKEDFLSDDIYYFDGDIITKM